MRTLFLIILIKLFASNINGQVSFSPIDSKLKESNNELVCSSSSTTVNFSLKRQITVLNQNNFVTVDSQVIQIMLLKFDGYNKETNSKNLNNQKDLLEIYSKYELEYFKNALNIEIINPNSQWVLIKSKGWFIWYFKVGNIPTQVDTKTEIQLFTTTVIGDKILIINAPILAGGDFSKAAMIVNEMMEALTTTEQ